MKGDKVYLLYDKADDTIQLQGEPRKGLQWEYLNKDEFTIVYRPQSADVGIRQGEGSVEGILFRRSSSLSTIEDLFLARRCPLIRPLLSETEIARIQRAQDQCRREHFELSGRKLLSDEVKTEDVQQLESLATSDLRPDVGGGEHPELGESPRDNLKTTSPLTDLKDKRKPSGTAAKLKKDKKEKRDDHEKDITSKRKPVGKTKLIDKERDKVQKPKKAEKSVKREEKPKAKITQKEKLLGDKVDVRETKSKKKGKGTDSDVLKESKKGNKKNADESESEIKKRKVTKGKKDLDSDDEVQFDKKKKKSLDEKINTNKSPKSKQKSSAIDLKTDTDGKENLSKKRTKSEPGKRDDMEKKQKRAREASLPQTEKSDKSASYKQSDKKGKAHKLEETDDETNKSRKPSVGKKKKQVGEDSDHQDVTPVDKSTKGMGEKSEGSGPKIKEGKAKSPLSKASLASPTTKDGKHPTILEHKKEKQIMPERRSKRLSSIENIIYYVLSNPIFIKMGWTLTPTDRTVSRVVTFHTTPANPQTYCFRQREEEETKFYPSGNLAVKMEIDGTGGIFYSNGSPAMLIKNTDTGMRLTMYSNPKKDPLMKNSFVAKIIGMFDSSGNGVIYDLEGNKIVDLGIRVDPEIVERIEDLAPDRVNGIPCVFDSLFHLSASLQELKNLHMEQSKTNIPGKYPPLKVN
ncbi:uncharacterized protein LOC124363074 isoform X2 [Homalodisca vitripennis]|uniref:uncharacterized protein LOC124363074 isoform X2 n=1 Tax=Homalodisca vitripennis TaxID=197043 RepID=UPI001EEC1FF9|nr:uncharacterized protein LOC124363074 isoform X2 [Homalodisca vitripennis]